WPVLEVLQGSGKAVGPPTSASFVSRTPYVWKSAKEPLSLRNHPGEALLADCRLEDLGDLGGGPIVGAAGPAQSRVDRRHAAVAGDGPFRPMIDQILGHARPAPLHRAE